MEVTCSHSSEEAIEAFEKQLDSPEEATLGERNDFGQKYVVRGTIIRPEGRIAHIETVWIVLGGDEIPRFVTAYPEKRP